MTTFPRTWKDCRNTSSLRINFGFNMLACIHEASILVAGPVHISGGLIVLLPIHERREWLAACGAQYGLNDWTVLNTVFTSALSLPRHPFR